MGVPAITSRWNGVHELWPAAPGWLVGEPGDVDEVARAMRSALDPARREAAAAVGRAIALAHSLEANFSRIEEVYVEVLPVRGERAELTRVAIGEPAGGRPGRRAPSDGPCPRRSPGCAGPRSRSGTRGGSGDASAGRRDGPGPHGPECSGHVGPNRATTGTPRAAAQCIGPVSPSPSAGRGGRARAPPRAAARPRRRRGAGLAGRAERLEAGFFPGPACTTTGASWSRASRSTSSRYRSTGQLFDVQRVKGLTRMKPRGGGRARPAARCSAGPPRRKREAPGQILDRDTDSLGDVGVDLHGVARWIRTHEMLKERAPPGALRAAQAAHPDPRSARVDPEGAPARSLEVHGKIEGRPAVSRQTAPRLEPGGDSAPPGVGLDDLGEVWALTYQGGEAAIHRHGDPCLRAGTPEGAQARCDVNDVAERGQLDDQDAPERGQLRRAHRRPAAPGAASRRRPRPRANGSDKIVTSPRKRRSASSRIASSVCRSCISR